MSSHTLHCTFMVCRQCLEEHLEECRQRRIMVKATPSSGMLAVLMVAMLVSGWTEGSVLSKCEMKSRLAAAFETLKSVAANDNLAKLVCTVEATSKFNTSLVTIIDLEIDEISTREGSGGIIDFSGDYSGQDSKEEPSGEEPLYPGIRFSERRIVSSFKLTENTVDSREFLSDPYRRDLDVSDRYELNLEDRSYERSQNSRVLYGIFQLSDDVACQSESKYSLNLCKLDCKDLINDDISDDIECLMTLKEQLAEMTFNEECHVVEPSGYFETCD
ncbi:hypothetical protein MHYP_G00098970 [Metynnis hypsauchen]